MRERYFACEVNKKERFILRTLRGLSGFCVRGLEDNNEAEQWRSWRGKGSRGEAGSKGGRRRKGEGRKARGKGQARVTLKPKRKGNTSPPPEVDPSLRPLHKLLLKGHRVTGFSSYLLLDFSSLNCLLCCYRNKTKNTNTEGK